MGTRYFALIIGIIYVLIGILGFIPGVISDEPVDDPGVTVETLYGRLLGIFPVNIIHTIVHLVVGISGVLAFRSWPAARGYSKAIAILFAILAIMGLIPGLNTVFGLIPLYGNDIWLHALTAVLAAYFGWVAPAPAETARV